jgi:hypothetical protein
MGAKSSDPVWGFFIIPSTYLRNLELILEVLKSRPIILMLWSYKERQRVEGRRQKVRSIN